MFLVAVFVVLLSVLYLLFSQQDAAVDDQVCSVNADVARFPSSLARRCRNVPPASSASLPACQPLAACILRSLTG